MVDEKKQPEKAPGQAMEQPPQAPPVAGKPLPPEEKSKKEELLKSHVELARTLGLPPSAPVLNDKPANAPAVTTAPAVTPEKAAGAPPEAGKQLPGGQPPAAGQPAAAEKSQAGPPAPQPENKPEGAKETPSGSMGSLFAQLLAALADVIKNIQNLDIWKRLSGLTETKPEEKKPEGEKYSEDELKKIAVDLLKNKDKVYPSQDKAVEYVASTVNLPVKETPQKFLEALTNSNMVLETDAGQMDQQPLHKGDLLFFLKENKDKKGEMEAYQCAVVSGTDPLKMKLIPKNGGVPQEMTVKESEEFKNAPRFGFVRLPKQETPPDATTQTTTPTTPTTAPASASPTQTPTTTPTSPT